MHRRLGENMLALPVRTFKNQLIEFINSIPLDWETKRLVVGEVYQSVSSAAELQINNEQAQIRKGEEDGGKNEYDQP